MARNRNVNIEVVIPLPMDVSLLAQILGHVTAMDARAIVSSGSANEMVVSFTAMSEARLVEEGARPTIRIGLDDADDAGVPSDP